MLPGRAAFVKIRDGVRQCFDQDFRPHLIEGGQRSGGFEPRLPAQRLQEYRMLRKGTKLGKLVARAKRKPEPRKCGALERRKRFSRRVVRLESTLAEHAVMERDNLRIGYANSCGSVR